MEAVAMSIIDRAGDLLGYCGGGEMSAAAFLPYVDHCSDQVLLLADGSVLAMCRMVGAPFSLRSNSDRNAQRRPHIAFLNAVADDNVEIHEHLVRHRGVRPMPHRPVHQSAYATRLMADWHGAQAPTLRQNDWFMSIRVKPRGVTLPAWVPFTSRQDRTEDLVRQLEDAMRLAFSILRATRPVRLGLRQGTNSDVQFSEIAEALHLIRTTRHELMPLVDPAGTLGEVMLCDDVICGRRGFEIRFSPHDEPGGRRFGAMLGLKSYPKKISVEKLDDLLGLDHDFVLTHALAFESRAKAQEGLDRIRRQMTTADDPAVSETEELRQAIDDVASGRGERGSARWSLAIHGDDLVEVNRGVTAAKNVLANAGAKATAESTAMKASFWGQLPGAPARCWIRPASLNVKQFATLTSLGGFPTGPERARWGGHPFRLATVAGTPFDYDQAVGDVLHSTVIAPNGGGKTVWIGFNLAAMDGLIRQPHGTHPHGTQILFDIDESNAQTILALGGRYQAIRHGDTGVAPLRGLADTPKTRAMLRDFVAGLASEGGRSLSPEERTGIAEGVDFVMGEVPPDRRRFAQIRKFMGFEDGGAGQAFEVWCHGGELGWVFDGDTHRVNFDLPLVGVDLTDVLEDARVMPPMAQMLLWMASEVMDGRRCMVWCEEAPAYLPEPRFARMAKRTALRARKRNAGFVAIAQMPEHLLQNEAGKAIIKQSRQIVALANPSAERSDYVDGLGFTEAQFAWVRDKMIGLPWHSVMVIRRDGQSGVFRFDLSEHPNHLAVLSGTTNSIRLMRSIVSANGNENPLANVQAFWRRLSEAAA